MMAGENVFAFSPVFICIILRLAKRAEPDYIT